MGEHLARGYPAGSFEVGERTARRRSTEMTRIKYLFEQLVRSLLEVLEQLKTYFAGR